jgi:hypothetical protein
MTSISVLALLARLGVVLAEDDSHGPVVSVLNAPVQAHQVQHLSGIEVEPAERGHPVPVFHHRWLTLGEGGLADAPELASARHLDASVLGGEEDSRQLADDALAVHSLLDAQLVRRRPKERLREGVQRRLVPLHREGVLLGVLADQRGVLAAGQARVAGHQSEPPGSHRAEAREHLAEGGRLRLLGRDELHVDARADRRGGEDGAEGAQEPERLPLRVAVGLLGPLGVGARPGSLPIAGQDPEREEVIADHPGLPQLVEVVVERLPESGSPMRRHQPVERRVGRRLRNSQPPPDDRREVLHGLLHPAEGPLPGGEAHKKRAQQPVVGMENATRISRVQQVHIPGDVRMADGPGALRRIQLHDLLSVTSSLSHQGSRCGLGDGARRLHPPLTHRGR